MPALTARARAPLPAKDNISQALERVPPAERLEAMLAILGNAPDEMFWPVFAEWFHRCENVWPQKGALLRRLRRAGPAEKWLSPSEQDALAQLSHRTQVFRGCPSKSKNGISWALSYTAAASFGHMHTASGRPSLVYEALVPKAAIFAVLSDRDDRHTVLLDPRRLHDVQRIDAPPEKNGWSFSFQPDANYFDDNDDGRLAELCLDAPSKWAVPFVALPPIQNMTDENLKAMLATKRAQIRFVWLARKEMEIRNDIRRAEQELAARERGAVAGRVAMTTKQKPKGKSSGRPRKNALKEAA